jgi:hypothetical protein
MVMAAVLVTACGGSSSKADMALLDMTQPVFLDVDLAGVDLAQPADLSTSPDLAWTDLAGGIDIAQAPDPQTPADMTQAVDLATVPPDMAVCSAVPSCGPPLAQLGCCNGALHCINNYCQNTTGEVCNTSPANGPVVTCYGGKACSASKKCG